MTLSNKISFFKHLCCRVFSSNRLCCCC